MRYTISFLVTSLLGSTALADVPKVVTDIAPVHSLVATVMGDLGQPDLLLPKGADPHDFQLRPSQAAVLANADLIFWIGPELTPWLDRALDGLEVTAKQIELMEAVSTETQAFGSVHDHDHDAEKDSDHKEEASSDHDEHDHEGLDPHIWLDPHNAENWLELIAAELARIDPENATSYAVNAETGKARIEALEADLANTLAPVADKPFMVFHDAYGYFTGHFGLNMAGAIRLGDATTPGAARLSALREDLRNAKAICLFPEVNHDPALAEQLAEGSPVRLGAALDPAGVTLDESPMLYDRLMRNLAQSLVDCLTAP